MQIRLVSLTAVLAMLANGCGEAPVQKPAAAARYIYDTGQTPYSAAICIARNARQSSDSIQAEERLVGDSATEVIVRANGERLSVVQIRRSGVKSSVIIEVFRAPGNDSKGFARRLMNNC